MIYEMRVYEAHAGKGDAMRDRFIKEVASKFFPRHGIELLGAFVSPEEKERFTYVTRFASDAERKKAWAAFGADPEWTKTKAATEIDGALLKSQVVSVLTPVIAGLVLD